MKRPPSIPPLGEAALGRIERGVFAVMDERGLPPAPARASRRRLFVFSLAGAVAAAAVFGVREWRRDETSPVRAALISTTTSGSHIAMAGATLDVAPESAVSFGGGRGGATVVVLDRGAVTCEVAPRSKRAPFIVEAGATRVTVIGTRFTVNRVGEHATVSVEHGLVEVADTDMTELVRAGERYRPGEPVALAPLAPLASEAPAAPAPLAVAVAVERAAVVPAPVVHSVPRPSRLRRLALADGSSLAPPPAARRAAFDVTPRPSLGAAASASDSEAAQAGAPDQRAGAQRGSIQVLFELAAQLEVRDPEAALRIYGEIATGEDAWAASALFASARLEAENGHAFVARGACEDYLRRFPRGPNADDARTLLATSR